MDIDQFALDDDGPYVQPEQQQVPVQVETVQEDDEDEDESSADTGLLPAVNEADLVEFGIDPRSGGFSSPRRSDVSRDDSRHSNTLNETQATFLQPTFLENITNRNKAIRQASTLLTSVMKADRAARGLEADDVDVEDALIMEQLNSIRTGNQAPQATRPPRTRTDPSQLLRDAMRQSVGPESVQKWMGHATPFSTSAPPPRATKEMRTTLNLNTTGEVTFAGHKLAIKRKPLDLSQIGEVRQYDKTKRAAMSPEGLQKFADRATGYVLGKKDKLTVPLINLTDDSAEKVMEEVLNLSSKLTTLKTHMNRFDIGDVMEVLVPKDVRNSSELEDITYNVLTDYSVLHPIQVANHITYLRIWVEDPYVPQNLAYTLQLIENNTDSRLWHKCLEQYEEFHEAQRGGPLMLLLILRQIQNTSDKALESLKAKLEGLNITEIPGEDIDHVVSLIKSTDKVLQTSSLGARSYTPTDLAKTCIDIFLTCSHPEFTCSFEQVKNAALANADMTGTSPIWPTVTALTNMATYNYARNRALGIWNDSKAKSSAFNASLTPHGKHQKSGGRGRDEFKCFNCNSTEHLADKCPKPKDERTFAANLKAFRDKRKSTRQGGNSSKSGDRSHRMAHGKPEIMNKNGFWVPDTKKLRELSAQSADPDTSDETSQTPQTTPTGEQAHLRFASPPESESSAAPLTATRSTQMRSILRNSASRSAQE